MRPHNTQDWGGGVPSSFPFPPGASCVPYSTESYFNKNIFMFESNSLITQAEASGTKT